MQDGCLHFIYESGYCASMSTQLPGAAVPYVQAAGTGRAHLLLGQVARTMVGAEETGGLLSYMAACGPAGRPIPLHHHDVELEVFLCTRGRVQLWAGEESRVLSPGDVGVVPAGTLHAYQFHSTFSEFVGPITPGGWDRFFDLTGTPYDGPAFPAHDPSPPPFAKFGQAEQQFKMKYFPEAPYAEPTLDAADDALPGAPVPYFLRAGAGPRHLLGGLLFTDLVTSAESDGTLSMAMVQGSFGPPLPLHVHARTHETIQVLDGKLRVWLDGEERVLTRGDVASIPASVPHTYAFESATASAVVTNAPGGLERLIALAGTPTEDSIFPAQAPGFPDLAEAAAELDVELV
ncbi:MAG: cupin protein [Conexibacter sp.]|nr:cupin protein [Conexibacter sp.]